MKKIIIIAFILMLMSISFSSAYIYYINETAVFSNTDDFSNETLLLTDELANFTQILSSSSGQYILVSGYHQNGTCSPRVQPVYRSGDDGASWSLVLNQTFIGGIAMSKSGQFMYIRNRTGILFSSDYGNTFSFSPMFNPSSCGISSGVACDDVGQYVCSDEYDSGMTTKVYCSSNFGISLTLVGTISSNQFNNIFISDDGSDCIISTPSSANTGWSNTYSCSGTAYNIALGSGTMYSDIVLRNGTIFGITYPNGKFATSSSVLNTGNTTFITANFSAPATFHHSLLSNDGINYYLLNKTGLYITTGNGSEKISIFNRSGLWGFATNFSNSSSFNSSIPPVAAPFQINNSFFSVKQCAVSKGNIPSDYICNATFYNPNDNGFYCDIDNMKLCDYGCEEVVYVRNISKVIWYDTIKSCAITNTGLTEGFLKVWCSPFWIQSLLSPDLYHNCVNSNILAIPTTSCVDNADVFTLLGEYANYSLYTEGQCLNQTCVDTCTNYNESTCANLNQVKKCILFEDGCYRNNITLTCGSSDMCSGGSCIAASGETKTPEGKEACSDATLEDGTMFRCVKWDIRMLISLIILTLIEILVVGGSLISGAGGKVAALLSVAFGVLGIFTFILLGGIQWWVGMLIAIISAGIVALFFAKATASVE